MEKLEREIMQVSKEIAVKFIEAQRLSPSNFEEIFPAAWSWKRPSRAGKNSQVKEKRNERELPAR